MVTRGEFDAALVELDAAREEKRYVAEFASEVRSRGLEGVAPDELPPDLKATATKIYLSQRKRYTLGQRKMMDETFGVLKQ